MSFINDFEPWRYNVGEENTCSFICFETKHEIDRRIRVKGRRLIEIRKSKDIKRLIRKTDYYKIEKDDCDL